jgi:oxepin-CoA hydrolase/3-oxo-5,6-dehydrosuberyl-CoA semialdehyde dehydrogenase
VSEDDAAKIPLFERRIAHGYLVISFAAGLFFDPDFGPVLANYDVLTMVATNAHWASVK